MCPALYCTLSFWNSIGIDEQHVFQIRPERSQVPRLVRIGVMLLLTKYTNHWRYTQLLDSHFQYQNPFVAAYYGWKYSDGMAQLQRSVLKEDHKIAKVDKAIAKWEFDDVMRNERLDRRRRRLLQCWAVQDMQTAAGVVRRGRRRKSAAF
jgi:hypothetical protein